MEAVLPTRITLKLKYRCSKPKGKNRADYMGNAGPHRPKHLPHPRIHGICRKRIKGRVK